MHEEHAKSVQCDELGAPRGVRRWKCEVELKDRSGTLLLRIHRDGSITTRAKGIPGFVLA